MKPSSSSKLDPIFGQTMRTLRSTIGLTQVTIAKQLGVSQRAVGNWEAGRSYPKGKHLKQFIIIALKQQAFPSGQEKEAIRAFWRSAHQKELLDEVWLSCQWGLPSSLLLTPQPTEQASLSLPAEGNLQMDWDTAPPSPRVPEEEDVSPQVDWGTAPVAPTFYGREQELSKLTQWVLQERYRLVCVLGMGGVGKSTLVIRTMQQLAEHFQVVIFRSLRDAPSCEALLDECLQVLASQLLNSTFVDLEQRISLVLEHLRTTRVLLVLDNLESILEEGETRCRLRPSLQGYERLLQQVAETAHQSCLLLTSREKPTTLQAMESHGTLVHSLLLTGLDVTACEHLLTEHELFGSQEERACLIEAYAGNPLALKIVAEMIDDLFGGAIAPFLAQKTTAFGHIWELLDEQYRRISALEQTLISWLAIGREPASLNELRAIWVRPLPPGQLLEAVDRLYRRSLIERGQHPGSLTLQTVVLEYVSARLVTEAASEIQHARLKCLIEHGFSLAHAKEYIRQAQERLLLVPLLEHLWLAFRGKISVEMQLSLLLDQVRTWAVEAQGYGPANLVTLLRLLRGDLRGCNLGHLLLRGLSLQDVQMQETTCAGATFRDTIFTETFDAIEAVAVSRSGEYWAASSMRGEVRIWGDAGQTLRLVRQAHADLPKAIAFSPDEHLFASGSIDGNIRCWEVASGTLLWSGWHAMGILSLAFAPDGSVLASGGGNTITFWDPQHGTHLQDMLHPSPLNSLAWNPDGRLLASGDYQGQIRVWQRQNNQPLTCIQTIVGHSSWVTKLAFSPDGRLLASSSCDSSVKLWEVTDGRLHRSFGEHTNQVNCVVWSPDGRWLASSGFDHTIRLWDVEEKRSRMILQGHTSVVDSLAFIPDTCNLLSGSSDGTLRVWDTARGQCVRLIQGYTSCPLDLDWHPDGKKLASADADTLMSIWDLEREMPPRTVRAHSPFVSGVAWSPDGKMLASCGWDNAIRLWDASTLRCLAQQCDPDYTDTIFCGMAWSPNGKLLAVGTFPRGILIWDVMRGSQDWLNHMISNRVNRVAWSPDGSWLAAGDEGGHVYVWETTNDRELRQLLEQDGAVMSVAWSPNGTRLVSASHKREQSNLVVWNVQNGECMRTFAGLPGVTSTVIWDPDGQMLISAGSNGLLRWWDVQSGECRRQILAHQGMVHAIKVSPDEKMLASCGDDGTIKLWNVSSGEHLRTLRRDRPYERLDITGVKGLTEAQKAILHTLGAIETEV